MQTSMSHRQVDQILSWLERRGTRRNRDGMARYGIRAAKVFGVSMATMRPLVVRMGRNHDLALALWDTGWHEARLVASFVDDPARVTRAQMDRWCHDFDNWAVCDSVCIHLFDRTPHALAAVARWSRRRAEFEKRAAFALLAGLAVHDTTTADGVFDACLAIVERAATDDRNYVKKSVNWALRQVGKRNLALHASASAVAQRLAASASPSARWIGNDTLRELSNPQVHARIARRRRGRP